MAFGAMEAFFDRLTPRRMSTKKRYAHGALKKCLRLLLFFLCPRFLSFSPPQPLFFLLSFLTGCSCTTPCRDVVRRLHRARRPHNCGVSDVTKFRIKGVKVALVASNTLHSEALGPHPKRKGKKRFSTLPQWCSVRRSKMTDKHFCASVPPTVRTVYIVY